MDAVFVLVHSPSVGPGTWAPVAELLRARGAAVLVPSLADVGAAGAPFWPRVVELAGTAIAGLPPERPVVLVAHSNAGLFVPTVAAASPRPVAGCLFVDASLPERGNSTPVASPTALASLRGLAVDGVLPPWTTWFDDGDVAPMFPDARTRAEVEAEEPRLPLSFYEQRIPVPDRWDAQPCGYLLFGPPYEREADEAAARGWAVERIPGRHLHQLVDPAGVAERIAGMARTWSPPLSPAGSTG